MVYSQIQENLYYTTLLKKSRNGATEMQEQLVLHRYSKKLRNDVTKIQEKEKKRESLYNNTP